MLISKRKINILKNFTTFLFIFISLFSYTTFSDASSADFYITPDKSSALVGQTIKITATKNNSLFQSSSDKAIFSASPAGILVFSPKECTLDLDLLTLNCSVNVTSQKPGAFTITAFTVEDTIPPNKLSASISITFTDTNLNSVATETNYVLLQKLPNGSGGELTNFESNDPCPFGKYLNILIKLFFGIAGVLAVVMIVMGGIQYMTSDLISSKEEGIKSMTNAIFGLLLALGAWVILNTINPDLLNVCLNNIEKQTIIISEESVMGVGPGVNIDGNTLKISTGSAVKCTGGIVQIPSDIGSGKICKDLLDRLQILKQKYPNWRVTSTLRNGAAQSSCHYEGFANSGNCVDLQINSSSSNEPGWSKENGSPNQSWGNFCVAVAQTGGLNFLNEASKVANCQNLQTYKSYTNTSGPHLHTNFIGTVNGNTGTNNNQTQEETYGANPTFINKTVFIPIVNYNNQNEHRVQLSNTATSYYIIKISPNFTSGQIAITLSDTEYSKLKGTSKVLVTSAGKSLGEKTLIIP